MPDVVVVTGSAQGLGRAVVERFVKEGSTVIGLDLRIPDDALCETFAVDITDRGTVEEAFDRIVQEHGNISICINAAGVYPRSTVANFDVQTYRLLFDVNVLGTWLVSAAFAARARPGGVLLNVASDDGIAPEPKSLLYSASKAAVINLTGGIAGEFAARGLRVVGIAPGYIATDTVRALAGTLPADAAEPDDVARVIWRLTADGGLPLVSGETLLVRSRTVLDV